MKSQNPWSVRAFITAILRAYTLGGFYQWYYCVDQNIRELQVSKLYINFFDNKKKNYQFCLRYGKLRFFRMSFLNEY